MSDQNDSTVTRESLRAEIASALREALPLVVEAAKAAVSVQQAINAPVKRAAPVVDRVDALVMAHTGRVPADDAVLAHDDPESRVAALEHHVAALTVATAHDTSAKLADVKAGMIAQTAAATEVRHAVDTARA